MEVAHVEDGYVEYLKELFTHPALCTTCLDEGKEVAAHPKPYRTYMYCVDHHPGIQAAKRREQKEAASKA
jgi:hypothetical protein